MVDAVRWCLVLLVLVAVLVIAYVAIGAAIWRDVRRLAWYAKWYLRR